MQLLNKAKDGMGPKTGARHRFIQAWRNDAGLSALLVFLSLLMFVMGPLRAYSLIGGWMLDVAIAMFALAGVLTITERPRAAWTGGALAFMAIALAVGHQQMPSVTAHVVRNVIMEAYLAILAWGMIHQVLRPSPVNRHCIMGSVVAYLLLGLIWAQSYDLVEELAAGSFTPVGSTHGAEWSGFLYFSLVTLTTVGYGDITAIGPIARSLVTAEAVIGHLFPTILIARLVSQALQARTGHGQDRYSWCQRSAVVERLPTSKRCVAAR